MKAVEIIEPARSYYFLSKDHPKTGSKPILVGGRIKLEFALENIDSDMIIATSGNDKRCIILMDYSDEECLALVNRATRQLLRIRSKN